MSTIFINSYVFGGFAGAYDAIPNLVHVYEIARRTLTSYTGSLVRIRRSSDNAEQDFGYVANGDLDTAAIATFVGAGSGFIKTIYDQKGTDNVTQATTTDQPLFVASGQNGRPVIRDNGETNIDRLRVTFAGALSQPYTVYALAKLNASKVGDGTNVFLVDGTTSGGRMALFKFGSGSNAFATFAGAALSDGSNNANWNIWSSLFNGASSQLWLNGSSVASGNAGTQNAAGIAIGTSFNIATAWIGDIGPVIIADPNHDATQRAAMETAINSYYAIF